MALEAVGDAHHGMNERLHAQAAFDQTLDLWRRHDAAFEAESLRSSLEAEAYDVPEGRADSSS